VRAFARSAAQLQGQAPLQDWERLMQESQPGLHPPAVTWSARGEIRAQAGGPDQVWLHLLVSAALPQVCQRCLSPALIPLEVDRSFRFVPDEATAMALDDEAQEDLLVLSRDFNLLELVEDELILAMPLVPLHEICPAPLPMSAADPQFEAATEQRPHPFAALAGWKVPKS
jgi:uncharacterized protein